MRLRRAPRRRGRQAPDEPLPELVEITAEDRAYLAALHDDSVPLPPEAAELDDRNPRLGELREAYAAVDAPVTVPSRWSDARIEEFLDLRWFRGESLITWHNRELPRVSRLKYFAMLRDLEARDELGLFERLDEDGLFGCWRFAFAGRRPVSVDLLQSVAELSFLGRHWGLEEREAVRVLDVGAGYGRLAHRMTAALGGRVVDYCCVDAIPEATFLSEFYLGFRGVAPPARVVPLHELDQGLRPGGFDLAVNVHSFSECTLEAVTWWVGLLARLEVGHLLLVPNDATELLSLEPDGSRRDFGPVLGEAGYELVAREPVYADPAVRELALVEDHLHLFALRP